MDFGIFDVICFYHCCH